MKLSRQFQFFKRRKITNFLPLRSCCAQKIVAFVVFWSLNFVLLVGDNLICVFVRLKFFRKKRMNWLKIFFIISFTILLTGTPINPPIKNLFVRSYFYLGSSVRISSFYENIFAFFFIC